MFDVGLSELVVIALVALIVLGPKRLPEVARAAGRWAARLRRFVSEVRSDFDRELQQADLAELKQLKHELEETRRLMGETSGRLMQDLQAAPAGAGAPSTNDTIAPPPDTRTRAGRRKNLRPRNTRHGSRRKTKRSARRR